MKKILLGVAMVGLSGITTAAHASHVESYSFRGMIGPDTGTGAWTPQATIGVNVFDGDPYAEYVQKAQSLGGREWLWLGGFNASTCKFAEPRSWLQSHISPLLSDPKLATGIAGYYVADEPSVTASCPSAARQIGQRTAYIHSLDPKSSAGVRPTFIVIYHQFGKFHGQTDLWAIDQYPCSIANGCDYTELVGEDGTAAKYGMPYMAVIQAFGDSYYALPTEGEFRTELADVHASNALGYIVFAWQWPSGDSKLWLSNHPELQCVLATENGASGGC